MVGEGDNYQETRISLQQNTYDGLGRTLSEAVGLLGERVNKYSYDVFGRQLEQTLADGAKVVRTFAKHSNADLPTSISVAGKELGQKEYDGLDREKVPRQVSASRPTRIKEVSVSPARWLRRVDRLSAINMNSD